MLFVWGRKITRINMGRCADFCRICRRISAFRVTRLDQASHVYFVAVDGSPVMTELCCEGCGVRLFVPGEISNDVCFDKTLRLEDLISKTNRHVYEVYAERLRVEQHLKSLDARTRAALILEPFEVLCGHVLTRRYFPGVALILPLLAGAGVIALTELTQSVALQIAGTLGIGIVTCGLMVRIARARHTTPPIVRALIPLQPSIDELHWAIGKVAHQDLRLRSHFNALKIHRQIEMARVQYRQDGTPQLWED